MKRFLTIVALLLCGLAHAYAQVSPSTLYTYNWPVATATGVVGQYLNFDNPLTGGGPPYSYTVQAYVTGTLPSVCTFEVQSSPDGAVWDTGTASLSGDQTCASATTLTYSFISKPVSNLRINIGTLTGADGTTQIHFFWKRAKNG
jgi:hypothetical protein